MLMILIDQSPPCFIVNLFILFPCLRCLLWFHFHSIVETKRRQQNRNPKKRYNFGKNFKYSRVWSVAQSKRGLRLAGRSYRRCLSLSLSLSFLLARCWNSVSDIEGSTARSPITKQQQQHDRLRIQEQQLLQQVILCLVRCLCLCLCLSQCLYCLPLPAEGQQTWWRQRRCRWWRPEANELRRCRCLCAATCLVHARVCVCVCVCDYSFCSNAVQRSLKQTVIWIQSFWEFSFRHTLARKMPSSREDDENADNQNRNPIKYKRKLSMKWDKNENLILTKRRSYTLDESICQIRILIVLKEREVRALLFTNSILIPREWRISETKRDLLLF